MKTYPVSGPCSRIEATLPVRASKFVAFALLMVLHVISVFGSEGAHVTATRPVTVADAIRMTTSADFLQGRPLAHYSPDGTKFVVVLRKGNLDQGTNDFSLLLWKTGEIFRSAAPAPEVLLTMSSSSNRDAISNVKWLSDDETIMFLGEQPSELQQLYTFNIRTSALKKLTNHPSSLVSYSTDAGGNAFAYLAEQPEESIWNNTTRREGVTVTTQSLARLMAGKRGDSSILNGGLGGYQVVYTSPSGRTRVIKTLGKNEDYLGTEPAISPNGRYIVVATQVTAFQDNWNEYKDPDIRDWLPAKLSHGRPSWLKQFELIDTVTGKSDLLLNSPQTYGYGVAWSPNSQAIVMSGIYLPLDGTEGDERRARQSAAFAVEVKIPSRQIAKIGSAELKVVDVKGDRLVFEIQKRTENWKHGAKVFFRRDGDQWKTIMDATEEESQPEIVLKQDMATPPQIVAINPRTRQPRLLLDLNPQFKELKFARVEAISWKGGDGQEVKGGLYYPVDYVPGKKYPLVIQTHWFTPDLFWIDGPWTTAFAAQPLAGKDIMVLQADEDLADLNTLREVQREVSTFEAAIADLDHKGLIDPKRVGLIGFSHTCTHVKYALTHSKYPFAAASVTDGTDAGYLQYIIEINACPDCVLGSEQTNGGLPFGEGLKSWIANSPGFNIDKVDTPLLITALHPASLLREWEWFAGLTRLGKPVEMIYIQDGSHELRRPWDRLVSQQGNVDWFVFWLKDQEDPDPKKRTRYRRWEEMREHASKPQ